MKWIEFIRTRSTATELKRGADNLKENIDAIRNSAGLSDVVVLRHALYDGDLAALLVWDNDRVPVKTREGMILAEHLRQLGSVDHAVWNLAEGFERE